MSATRGRVDVFGVRDVTTGTILFAKTRDAFFFPKTFDVDGSRLSRGLDARLRRLFGFPRGTLAVALSAHAFRMDAPFCVFEGVAFQSFFLGPMFPGLGRNSLERPSSRTATCFMPTVFASQ